jgi:hypothetical protein
MNEFRKMIDARGDRQKSVVEPSAGPEVEWVKLLSTWRNLLFHGDLLA